MSNEFGNQTRKNTKLQYSNLWGDAATLNHYGPTFTGQGGSYGTLETQAESVGFDFSDPIFDDRLAAEYYLGTEPLPCSDSGSSFGTSSSSGWEIAGSFKPEPQFVQSDNGVDELFAQELAIDNSLHGMSNRYQGHLPASNNQSNTACNFNTRELTNLNISLQFQQGSAAMGQGTVPSPLVNSALPSCNIAQANLYSPPIRVGQNFQGLSYDKPTNSALIEPEPFPMELDAQLALPWTQNPHTPTNLAFANGIKMHKVFEGGDEMCGFALDEEPKSQQLVWPYGNMLDSAPQAVDMHNLPYYGSFDASSILPVDIDGTLKKKHETKKCRETVNRQSKNAGVSLDRKIKHQPTKKQYEGVPNGDELLRQLGIWPRWEPGAISRPLRVVDLRRIHNMREHSTITKRANASISKKWGDTVYHEYRRIQDRLRKSSFDQRDAIEKAITWAESLNSEAPMQRFSDALAMSTKEVKEAKRLRSTLANDCE